MANPGPGKGCLSIKNLLTFNCLPIFLTSSLNISLKGSIKDNFIFLGSPPTL